MAVYTEVTDDALAAFLTDYDIGGMVAFRGTRHQLPAAGARARWGGAAPALRPARRDHHLPARRLATPGAARALRAAWQGAGRTAPGRCGLRAGPRQCAGAVRLVAAGGALPAGREW